jgi:predicted enzyme related to lactoylglutathione lyase
MPQGSIDWLEIPAADLDASPKFYEVVFGWTIMRDDKWPDFPMFKDAGGKMGGGFSKQAQPNTEPGIMLYITVDDIEAALAKVNANNGVTIKEKTTISEEVGWWASFKDPGGNTMGLFQTAKQ